MGRVLIVLSLPMNGVSTAWAILTAAYACATFQAATSCVWVSNYAGSWQLKNVFYNHNFKQHNYAAAALPIANKHGQQLTCLTLHGIGTAKSGLLLRQPGAVLDMFLNALRQ